MARSGSYQFHLDTRVEVWARGGNADRINYDRVEGHYYNGLSPDQAAASEMRHWRAQREAREMQEEAERQAEEYAQQQQAYEAQDAEYYAHLYEEHLLDTEYGPVIRPPVEIPF